MAQLGREPNEGQKVWSRSIAAFSEEERLHAEHSQRLVVGFFADVGLWTVQPPCVNAGSVVVGAKLDLEAGGLGFNFDFESGVGGGP